MQLQVLSVLSVLMAVCGGAEEGLSNVALYKPTSKSTEYGIYDTPYNAVDGVLRTDIKFCFHTAKKMNSWWRVDLGRLYEVHYVKITNRGDCCGHRLKNFNVVVSAEARDDPQNSPQSEVCHHQTDPVSQGSTAKLPCSGALVGRYVTVVLLYRERLHFCELEVMGRETAGSQTFSSSSAATDAASASPTTAAASISPTTFAPTSPPSTSESTSFSTISAPTETPTPAPTETSTPAPTETSTPAPTETSTPAPTETTTPAPTEISTPAPTLTTTPAPTETSTPAPTETTTPAPTETSTPAPTETTTPAPTTASQGSSSDACQPNPCLGGKVCSLNKKGRVKCSCPKGQAGQQCRNKAADSDGVSEASTTATTDSCDPNPCQDGKECKKNKKGKVKCVCPKGKTCPEKMDG